MTQLKDEEDGNVISKSVKILNRAQTSRSVGIQSVDIVAVSDLEEDGNVRELRNII